MAQEKQLKGTSSNLDLLIFQSRDMKWLCKSCVGLDESRNIGLLLSPFDPVEVLSSGRVLVYFVFEGQFKEYKLGAQVYDSLDTKTISNELSIQECSIIYMRHLSKAWVKGWMSLAPNLADL